jgi:hypothetical protein
MPLRLRKALAYISQALGHDNVAVVFDGFRDKFVGDGMDVLFAPCFFTLPKAKQKD